MYSTYYKSGDSSRSMISSFGGINRRARIGDGESADMKNLSSDAYPLLCPRKARAIAQKQLSETVTETVADENGNETSVETTVYKSLNGILGDVGFCAVWGNDFYYMGEKVDGISLIDGEKRLVAFGAEILIYPDQKYYNTVTGESGNMDSGITQTAVLNITGNSPVIYFNDNGEAKTIKPYKTGGSYSRISVAYRGVSRANVSAVLTNKIFDADSISISSSYLNISDVILGEKNGELYYLYSADITGSDSHYTANNCVWKKIDITETCIGDTLPTPFDDTHLDKLWRGNVPITIEKRDKFYYIPNKNIMDIVTMYATSQNGFKVKIMDWSTKNIPAMDYVCVLDNRLWGCRYGAQAGSTTTVNEIYCSALGDFKNWTTGTTADSAWRASVGAYGKWTGCVAMNGRVLFFKDDKIFRVSGTKPSNFQYAEISETGLQSGCERSMSIIDGALFYKSRDGVYVYDGSTPERISDKLGDAQQAKSAAAGSLYGKYYIALDGVLYVYDTRTGLWHKEDAMNARIFARYDGSLYAAVDQSIVCLSGTPSGIFRAAEAEGRFDWYAESGDIGLDSPDQKYYKRILIRAEGAVGSDMTVTVKTDGEVQSVTDYTFDRKGTVVVPIVTPRCDHMRYRIGGHGDVKIYSISFETETVGDTPERR